MIFSFYVQGGCHTMQEEMTPRKEVLVYDKICGTWKPLAPLLTARMYHSLCVVKGQIYAIGGLGEDNRLVLFAYNWLTINVISFRIFLLREVINDLTCVSF